LGAGVSTSARLPSPLVLSVSSGLTLDGRPGPRFGVDVAVFTSMGTGTCRADLLVMPTASIDVLVCLEGDAMAAVANVARS